MPKYNITLDACVYLTYRYEVEADDENEAHDIAFDRYANAKLDDCDDFSTEGVNVTITPVEPVNG